MNRMGHTLSGVAAGVWSLPVAASVRGALTDALLAPLSRWHALNNEEAG